MVNPIFSFLDQLLRGCASVDDPTLCRQRVTDSERTEKRVNCDMQQLLQLSSAYAMHYARVLQCTMQEWFLSFLSFQHAVFCRGMGIHRMSAFFDGLLHPGEASEWLISSVWPRRSVPPMQRQVPRVGPFSAFLAFYSAYGRGRVELRLRSPCSSPRLASMCRGMGWLRCP